MNKILSALALLLVFCAATSFGAETVTVKGTITCAKCDLAVSEKCATVIVVTENDKDVIYYFEGEKKNPKQIFTTPKEGSVTGEISMIGNKHMILVNNVEYNP